MPVAAQQVRIGGELTIGEYREAAPSLRYRGIGPGVAGSFTFHRITVDGALVSLRMTPTDSSLATESFQATQIDAWLRWDALDYLGLEVGLTKRIVDAEFAAQSVGAARLGARTRYVLGPGAAVWARGHYLAGARFSGGGRAPFAMEIGLGLDFRWSSRIRAGLQYSFQRLDRTTNPAGGAEVSVPIEQSQARIGLAVGF